jgi:hypothetical protein
MCGGDVPKERRVLKNDRSTHVVVVCGKVKKPKGKAKNQNPKNHTLI